MAETPVAKLIVTLGIPTTISMLIVTFAARFVSLCMKRT